MIKKLIIGLLDSILDIHATRSMIKHAELILQSEEYAPSGLRNTHKYKMINCNNTILVTRRVRATIPCCHLIGDDIYCNLAFSTLENEVCDVLIKRERRYLEIAGDRSSLIYRLGERFNFGRAHRDHIAADNYIVDMLGGPELLKGISKLHKALPTPLTRERMENVYKQINQFI